MSYLKYLTIYATLCHCLFGSLKKGFFLLPIELPITIQNLNNCRVSVRSIKGGVRDSVSGGVRLSNEANKDTYARDGKSSHFNVFFRQMERFLAVNLMRVTFRPFHFGQDRVPGGTTKRRSPLLRQSELFQTSLAADLAVSCDLFGLGECSQEVFAKNFTNFLLRVSAF